MNWAWVAGIFEGEGNINITKPQGNKRAKVRITIAMTDEDVIDRLLEVTGVGTKDERRVDEKNPKHSRIYFWRIGRREEVAEFLTAILPYLLSRRTAKAEEALNIIAENMAVRGLPVGVRHHNDKFIAQYHRTYLGIFATPEEAKQAYELARKELHG